VPGDGTVTVGLRPEAMTPAADGTPNALHLTVEHVEWLGHETLAHLRAGDTPVVARLPGMHTLETGAPITVGIDPKQVYLFDADGRALR
jgi:glycerol transport system ATP-binding protein